MAATTIQDNADLGSLYVAGDTLLVTGKDTGNSTDITANLDQSALGAGGFNKVDISRNFRARMGSVSNPFKAEIASGGSPLFRWDAGVGSEGWYTPDGNTDIATKLRMTGPSKLNLIGAGTITNLEQLLGELVIGTSITPTTIRSAGGYMLIDGAGGANPTTIWCGGNGKIKTLRGFTTLNLFGNGNITIDCDSDALTTITMTGGMLDLVGCGTITTLNLYDGDASRIRIGRLITITTVNVWPTVRNVSKFLEHPYLTIGTKNWEVDVGEVS